MGRCSSAGCTTCLVRIGCRTALQVRSVWLACWSSLLLAQLPLLQMSEAPHRNVIRVIDAGRELGIDVLPRHFPQGAKTAQDAADAIGVDVGQIVKSLIFGVASDADELELVLAYVSGRNQLN